MWLILVFVVCLVFLYDYKQKCSRRWKLLCQFPGDYALPLIGNALQIGFVADNAPERLMSIWERHGKTNFRVKVGTEDWVMLCEPDDVGTILTHPSELAKPDVRNAAMRPFFGDSLSTSNGKKWKSMRKLMSPSFGYKTFEKNLSILYTISDRFVEILDEHSSKGNVNIYKYLRPFMYDVICSCYMGVCLNFLEDRDHKYFNASPRILRIINENYFSYWRHDFQQLYKLTNDYTEMLELIEIIRTNSKKIVKLRKDKLQKVVDDAKQNNKNSDIDVDKIVRNILINDETFLLDNLLLSKSIEGEQTPEEMIIEEVTLLCFTELTLTPNLAEMKYLDAVIKESIRVIPTVPKIGRIMKEDLSLKDGRVIPARCNAIIFYDALYRNPKIYPNPEQYNPERFLGPVPHQFGLVPFSFGPRSCIGFRFASLAIKATLSILIRRYKIFEGGPENDPLWVHRLLTESRNGLHLRLQKRTSC